MYSNEQESFTTSSPVQQAIAPFDSPLTVRVSTPINSQNVQYYTPIKKDSNDHHDESRRSSSPDSMNSSINVETDEKHAPSSGLLTFSTPIYPNNYVSAFHRPVLTSSSIYNSKINSQPRKPRVNFHSIDDLIGSKSEETNDSGIASYMATPACSFKIQSFENIQSPCVIPQYNLSKQNEESIQDEQDKENNSKKLTTSVPSDNSKKVRTTFTEHQKLMLDIYFQKNPYPDPKETEDLSQQLVLPENVIKVWFQNKRSRDKQRKFSNANRNKQQKSNVNQQTAENTPSASSISQMFSTLNSAAAMAAISAAVSASNFNNLYARKFF